MNAVITVFYFLFSLTFNIVLYALWIRVGLHYLKFSSLHPISNLIYSVTNPIVRPINNLLTKKGQRRSPIEWGSIVIIIVAELIKFLFTGLLFYGIVFSIAHMILFTVADMIVQPLNLLFYMILIRVIMSWIQPNWQHPAHDVLRAFTNPTLRLSNYIIPNISGFDFSPFFALVIIKVITLFISSAIPIELL